MAIGAKEFFQLTIKLVRNPGQNQRNQHIELNDRILSSFKFKEVFDDIEDNLDKCFSYRDPERWAKHCTKVIMNEHSHRKKIRQLCKDFANLNAQEEPQKAMNSHIHLLDDEKRQEF
mmetsp:Transcript_37535/g.33606  ORF Transcript_37535/g.33606 Transcript_37535/m.33606 type:complete len:117 (+) Transcript_37535:3728-4078(+)